MSNVFIKNDKVHVPHLEVHAAHACNLKCISCSHYSYLTPQKPPSLQEFEEQFICWSQKINPRTIRILGGEPFLNKQLNEFMQLIRNYFLSSTLVLVTNGLLIKKSKIKLNFINNNNTFLVISIHGDSLEYKKELKENMDYLDDNNIKHHAVYSNEDWRLTHNIIDDTLVPFYDGNTRKSWETCPAKNCKQLYENKIYKCPQTTYIKIVKNYKVHQDYGAMLDYRPLESGSSLEEIKNFWLLEDEDICSMCPAYKRSINKGNPLKDYKKQPRLL